MARPQNKQELLSLAETNYHRLIDFISNLPAERLNQEFPSTFLNRNVRDVIAHLHHWHTLIQNWMAVGMKGEKPEIPAKGYTWKTMPDLNRYIQNKYAQLPLDQAQEMLHESHKAMMAIINSYSNEELFERKRHQWTGTTSMGAYLISGTSSHYDWAFKLIKKCLKASK